MLKLQNKEQIAEQLINNLPDPVLFFTPLFNNNEFIENQAIKDFRLDYLNTSAEKIFRIDAFGIDKEQLVLTSIMSEADRKLFFKQCLSAWENNSPIEFTYCDAVPDRSFLVQCTKMQDGILVSLKDITNRKQGEQEFEDNKKLLYNIFDSSLNAICICEAVRDESGIIADLKFVQINQKFKTITPQNGEEITGKNLLELFPATDQATFNKHCKVIETGIPERFETYYKRDNFEAWYDVSSAKFGDHGVVITFADITEQKKSTLKMAEQKALLDNILKNSANAISVTRVLRDDQGKVYDGMTILANDAAIRYTGIPRDIYMSKTALEIDPRIAESPYFKLCVKTLETGDPQFSQYHLEPMNRWLEISISKLDEEHLITIFTDITPVKEAQLLQERLMDDLKRSNENLREFVYAASHDLKEPIRKIRFFSDQLKQRYSEEMLQDSSRLLERMENSAKRMEILVDDLLEYSHVSLGMERMEKIDLNIKMKVVLEELDLVIQEKKADIQIAPLPTVLGHRRQLQQLFQNLINNSLKYAKNGITPHVIICSNKIKGQDANINLRPGDQEKPFYLIELKDNGIGFDPKESERIFNVFTRLHGNTEYPGTGVGLSIAKKVVENHKGYIWADSTPGRGATFSILLPA